MRSVEVSGHQEWKCLGLANGPVDDCRESLPEVFGCTVYVKYKYTGLELSAGDDFYERVFNLIGFKIEIVDYERTFVGD